MDEHYGGGYFAHRAQPIGASREISAPEPRTSALKPLLVVLVVMAMAAGGGFFAWKSFFQPKEVVYLGSNGTVDAVRSRSLFVPVEGFTYRDLPGMAKGQVDGLMSQMGGLVGIEFDSRIKGLMQGGTFAGAVIALGVPPEVMESSLATTDVMGSLEEQAQGAEIERIELGGKPAVRMQSGPASTVIAFYENQIVMIATADEATTAKVATAILEAQP